MSAAVRLTVVQGSGPRSEPGGSGSAWTGPLPDLRTHYGVSQAMITRTLRMPGGTFRAGTEAPRQPGD